jgi:cytochrome c oxidase subunit 2
VRFWSVLFAIGALFCVATSVYAPFDPEWWLPSPTVVGPDGIARAVGRSVSKAGAEVDHLFIICSWLTGITFVGVAIAFVWFTWKYADAPGRKAVYTHGSKKLEIIWTLIPAFILVFIAVYQLGAWADIKYRSHQPDTPPIAEVTARQFQWISRYPGPDNRLHTADDVITVNDFHFYADEAKDEKGQPTGKHVGVPTVINLRAEDVLHSFFLPSLRVKQDAVPGLTIPVWFDADVPGDYELVCAELCGWGHYKMRGKVTVHPNKAEFERWLAGAAARQNFDGVTPPSSAPATPAATASN